MPSDYARGSPPRPAGTGDGFAGKMPRALLATVRSTIVRAHVLSCFRLSSVSAASAASRGFLPAGSELSCNARFGDNVVESRLMLETCRPLSCGRPAM